jgi:hypothetical protein
VTPGSGDIGPPTTAVGRRWSGGGGRASGEAAPGRRGGCGRVPGEAVPTTGQARRWWAGRGGNVGSQASK